MNLYSIRDKKANDFGTPMAMPTDAHAVRAFQQEVNRADTGNMLNQYPEDFAIYKIGTFDSYNGDIAPCKIMLLEAVAAKKPA